MKFSNVMQMKAYMKMEANKLSVTSAERSDWTNQASFPHLLFP